MDADEIDSGGTKEVAQASPQQDIAQIVATSATQDVQPTHGNRTSTDEGRTAKAARSRTRTTRTFSRSGRHALLFLIRAHILKVC